MANLDSLTKTFFPPVAASTYHSSPCSPESSRCTNETLVLSGLHFTVSGLRPVMPPSANMASSVRGFFCEFAVTVDWAVPRENIASLTSTSNPEKRFTSQLQVQG